MLGRTLLRINQETLVAALQLYFETKMPGQLVVTVSQAETWCSVGQKLDAVLVEVNDKPASDQTEHQADQ